ncbi:hypothetical protein BH10ACT10_BH10ACT10_21750 [soil metagenome]
MVTRSWSLDANPTAASHARGLLKEHCAARHPQADPGRLRTALLLVSELVTNAVRYGDAPIDLEVVDGKERFRVNVSDHSAVLPVQQDVDLWSEGGRGIMLVESLSSSWGVVEHPGDGKAVWFELPPFVTSA